MRALALEDVETAMLRAVWKEKQRLPAELSIVFGL
jgi:hypothetical protein